MELDLSLTALVNAAGAFLFVLVGAAVLALGGTPRRARLLGLLCLTFGLTYVLENVLVLEDGSTAALVATAPFAAASGVLALLLARDLARGLPAPHARWLAAYALVAVAVYGLFIATFYRPDAAPLLMAAGFPPQEGAGLLVMFAIQGQQLALAILLAATALRFHAERDPAARERHAALALAFGPFLMFLSCAAIASPSAGGSTGAALYDAASLAYAVLAVAAIAPLAAPTRVGLRARLGFPALALVVVAGLAVVLASGVPFQDRGGYGIARTIGAAFLAHAILRADLLGVPLPGLAKRRGAIFTGAFAALLIVAQFAQNFFEAQYGLLMGSLVAGALVVAAAPIQRALERGADALGAPRDPARAQEAYRAAVRLALDDGRVSEREEERLAEVAEHLGLGPIQALRLRKDVEREARGR